MYARAKVSLIALLVLLLSGSLALAQVDAPSPGQRLFAQQELDQMLAPIALYPDALLSQILMAATYPREIVEAARWSRRNPDLDGDRAVRAIEWADWDPSVKSLVAFPQILARMDENLDWAERLGDAFLIQQADVMDSVQYLRQKADLTGNLGPTEQLRVARQGSAYVIEYANPEFVYVPYYNPAVVYGAWWWPSHPPVAWAAWPGYHVRPGVARGYAWGPAIPVSRNFFFGATDWQRRSVTVVNVNNYYYQQPHARAPVETTRNSTAVWRHQPAERQDIPYRDASLRQPSDRMSAAPEARADFRRHGSSAPEVRSAPASAKAPASPPPASIAATIPASSVAVTHPASSPPALPIGHRQVVAHTDARLNPERPSRSPNMPAAVSQPETRGTSVPPAAPSGAAAATPPEGSTRGHGGRTRHQQQ